MIYFHNLNIAELRLLCEKYRLPSRGNKIRLINRIVTFVETGTVVEPFVIPDVSQARKGGYYPLELKNLMLYGAYKNDAKSRAFFKAIIGDYFHFTAFGIDWLNERWLSGNPQCMESLRSFGKKNMH